MLEKLPVQNNFQGPSINTIKKVNFVQLIDILQYDKAKCSKLDRNDHSIAEN